MTPVSRSTAIEMWKSGRSPASSVVRGWSHSRRIASRPPTMSVPVTKQRPVASTFWQYPAGWTNVSGSVSAGSAVIGS